MTETEEKILETLVSRGGASAGSLSRLTGIKRPTVYAALSSLCNMGVVTVHESRGAQQYRPAKHEALKKRLLENVASRYKGEVVTINRILERLASIEQKAPQHLGGYELQAYESRISVRDMLEEKLLGGNFSAIFNPQVVLQAEIKKLVTQCLRKHASSKPHIRELCVDGPATREYIGNIQNPNHHVRLINSKANIKTDMIFKNNTVTMLHYDLDSEFAVRITHEGLFCSMLAIFEQLWGEAAISLE